MKMDWFAIYTKPRSEKKVYERLRAKGFECYLPLKKVLKKWSDRKKLVDEPLISSYVFVKTSASDQLTILKDPGVLNFVYWLGKPAQIKDDEILRMKIFLGDYTNVSVEAMKFNAGDKVRLTSGAIDDCATVVTQQGEFVYLTFPNLGFQIKAKVDKVTVTH